ncbi:MAG: signal peptidase I, partial [Gemmatimonadetes bacterium]|nr:signal peptidase I [Gemmatimonadota bacterium]
AGTRWPGIYYMTGPSMEPTVRAGEYFLVWNPPGHLARGDLVVFRYEDGDGVFHVLRRLAGLPGDTIAMREGAIVVNGAPQPWRFRIIVPAARRSLLAGTEDLYTWGPWTVPPESVVLLSDTRDMLGWPDSRFLGFIPRTDIVGKATRTLRGRALRD